MKGLLWAEKYIEEGIFFEDDETGVESLNWELFYSGRFDKDEYLIDGFFKGASKLEVTFFVNTDCGSKTLLSKKLNYGG